MISAFLRTTERLYLPIDDIDLILSSINQGKVTVDFMMAKLVIVPGDREVWALEDRMDWLLQEFCLKSSEALLSGSDYCFTNWEYHSSVRLGIADADVKLQKDGSADVFVPGKILLRAMLDCAAGLLLLIDKVNAIHAIANFSIMPGMHDLLFEDERLYAEKYGADKHRI